MDSEWSMTESKSGASCGLVQILRVLYIKHWQGFKKSIIGLRQLRSQERIACSNISQWWEKNMVQSIMVLFRCHMYFRMICLNYKKPWPKTLLEITFLNQVQLLKVEEFLSPTTFKNWAIKSNPQSFQNTLITLFSWTDTNLIYVSTLLLWASTLWEYMFTKKGLSD